MDGWQRLVQDHGRLIGEGHYPLPAYSEFMPPPRLGLYPYRGEIDHALFSEKDLYGWQVPEIEEEYELVPGLQQIAKQMLEHVLQLGRVVHAHPMAGHLGRNLKDNPYWPPDLAARAASLMHERHVVLLPLVFSKTQDDLGRVRWTFFGSSEQGPERAFWSSFYFAPGKERPAREGISFLVRLLSEVFGEQVGNAADLDQIGFRLLPTRPNEQFPYWTATTLPTWTQRFLIDEHAAFDWVRYLLTFRPFSDLPAPVREKYLAGALSIIPFPGSLVFWGMPNYIHLQRQLPLALQLPLLRLAARHDAASGVRVPQSGWLHEPRRDSPLVEIEEALLLNTYKRTNRWQRIPRSADPAFESTREDKVTRVLFSAALEAIGLYDKPMARNAQIWTRELDLLLNGPIASRAEIERAAAGVLAGGAFRYRFLFPAMRVGRYEVYWHRPLVAYRSPERPEAQVLRDAPLGYLTAYPFDAPDPAQAVELWPRLLRRGPYLSALEQFADSRERYQHETPLNLVTLLDIHQLLGGSRLPRSFAQALIRRAKHKTWDQWLASLQEKADDPKAARRMQANLRKILEPAGRKSVLPPALTYDQTATREFEVRFWNDIAFLSNGRYSNKDNADIVQDEVTLKRLTHHERQLGPLGDYLIRRHQEAIVDAGMEGRAVVGELPFHWRTDFDYSPFGGWKGNQTGREYERNLLVMIPGRNRREAVIMADHYDTAYMEDVFDTARGGSGARLAAPGADDNASATTTLLQAAPIFMRMARAGQLLRDVWLLHLTGEEFPSDCMGARHVCEALVEKTLKLQVQAGEWRDLSEVRIAGVFVLDMIAHNRDDARNIFQISPGTGAQSLQLACQAHLANLIWNAQTAKWNRRVPRRGASRGRRSRNGKTIPRLARHPVLDGQVRTFDDPQSSLYNTDGIVFSDAGVPVVLFMENYDLGRTGYHDSKDTLVNIDLDYGAALSAIAIETVARVATQAN
ncbi:MAG: M28 family peptidase [Anaerolineae bacterium]